MTLSSHLYDRCSHGPLLNNAQLLEVADVKEYFTAYVDSAVT